MYTYIKQIILQYSPVILFGLILYVPVNNFHLSRDGSSWVEPVLSKDNCFAQRHNTLTPVRPLSLESSTLPLSHCAPSVP